MGPILILLFHHIRKSFQSIFLGFILPIILLVILMAIIGTTLKQFSSLVIPAASMSVAPILGIVSLANSYADIKNSIIIKRIGATPLKDWKFILCVILFYAFLILIGIFWVMSFGTLVYQNKISFEFIHWGYIILASLLIAIMSSLFGLMIGIVASNASAANALGFLTYIPTSFLSGQYIPYFTYWNNQGLQIVAKMIPFSYPVSITNLAWTHYSVGDEFKNAAMFDNYWLPFTVSIVWILVIGALVLTLYKFRRK